MRWRLIKSVSNYHSGAPLKIRHSREGGNPEVIDLSYAFKMLDSRLRRNDGC